MRYAIYIYTHCVSYRGGVAQELDQAHVGLDATRNNSCVHALACTCVCTCVPASAPVPIPVSHGWRCRNFNCGFGYEGSSHLPSDSYYDSCGAKELPRTRGKLAAMKLTPAQHQALTGLVPGALLLLTNFQAQVRHCINCLSCLSYLSCLSCLSSAASAVSAASAASAHGCPTVGLGPGPLPRR